MLDSLEALLWVKDVVEVYGILVVSPVSSLRKMHTSELISNRSKFLSGITKDETPLVLLE